MEVRTSAAARFPAHPASAARARHFVKLALARRGLGGADVAELLVSEVVTNAVLHAGTEIEVRVAVDEGRARVEVADGSAALPTRVRYEAESATGRGLELVDAMAQCWGVERTGHGKVVWFELESTTGAATGAQRERGGAQLPASRGGTLVRFARMPLRLVWATVQYSDALLRELTLLRLSERRNVGGDASPPLSLAPLLEPVRAAIDAGRTTADVVVSFPHRWRGDVQRRLALVDEADRLAEQGRLLLPPALPEVRACRRWLLHEILRQLDGASPAAWEPPADQSWTVAPGALPARWIAELARRSGAVVAADDRNCIVFANEEAGSLLGWPEGELVGQRLTVLFPPEEHDAHLELYSAYLMTGRAASIERPVDMLVLRRDGVRLRVRLRVDVVEIPPQRLFVACLVG